MTGLILPRHAAETRARVKGAKARIEALLREAYPFHLFQVEVTPAGDCYIDHMLLSQSGGRYYFHMRDFIRDEKVPLRQFGELLERVGIPRTSLESLHQYADAKPAAKEAFSCR